MCKNRNSRDFVSDIVSADSLWTVGFNSVYSPCQRLEPFEVWEWGLSKDGKGMRNFPLKSSLNYQFLEEGSSSWNTLVCSRPTTQCKSIFMSKGHPTILIYNFLLRFLTFCNAFIVYYENIAINFVSFTRSKLGNKWRSSFVEEIAKME